MTRRGSAAAFRGCGSPDRLDRPGVAVPDIVRGRPAGHVASLEISVKAARNGLIPTAVADEAGYRRWHRCGRCSASTDASSITLADHHPVDGGRDHMGHRLGQPVVARLAGAVIGVRRYPASRR